jgi:hypothetical protein
MLAARQDFALRLVALGFGSYETAHSMCHKIHAALIAPEAKLGGIVEVDETWIGGKLQERAKARSAWKELGIINLCSCSPQYETEFCQLH